MITKTLAPFSGVKPFVIMVRAPMPEWLFMIAKGFESQRTEKSS